MKKKKQSTGKDRQKDKQDRQREIDRHLLKQTTNKHTCKHIHVIRKTLTSLWSEKLHYKFIQSAEDCDFMLALDAVWPLRRIKAV